jgi:glycosyltransferase involved in cell wall biosynthesis
VIWAGQQGEQVTVYALQRACHVFVLPSDREPWGTVIEEAAAAGMAIVSSSVPGAVAELVRDGVNGRIFPAGDLNKLIECLLDVTEEGRAEEMGAASPGVLQAMRRELDPIQGLRRALEFVQVLPSA